MNLRPFLTRLIHNHTRLEAALTHAATAEAEIDGLLHEKLTLRTQLTAALKRAQTAEAAVSSAAIQNAQLVAEVETLKLASFSKPKPFNAFEAAKQVADAAKKGLRVPSNEDLEHIQKGGEW